MGYFLQALAISVALLLLWAVLASPLLLAFFFAARSMRRKGVRSGWAIAGLASSFSVLAAPVPTPIITVFLPHVLALFDSSYYSNIFKGPEPFAGLLFWIISSLMLTFSIALAAAWRYVRRPNISSKRTRVPRAA
jgi:hypothetical protein